MKDNCENRWGCDLVRLDQTLVDVDILPVQFEEVQQALQEQISSLRSPFELVKVEGCGSHANLYAINSVTFMNPQQYAIAARSYISGDHGPLQSLTSCVEYEDKSLTIIATPEECAVAAQNIMPPFPYYIPGGCINQKE
jgi:hypothetical protein